MSTLVEEIVRAISVPEVIILPWFPCAQSLPHGGLIDQNVNRPQITFEISGIVESPRQFRRFDVGIELSRYRTSMTQPRL